MKVGNEGCRAGLGSGRPMVGYLSSTCPHHNLSLLGLILTLGFVHEASQAGCSRREEAASMLTFEHARSTTAAHGSR